jgi:predicted DNA-binding ribbon-helix-helix protein
MVCGQPFWGTIEALARQHNIDGSSLIKALNHKKREIDAKS